MLSFMTFRCADSLNRRVLLFLHGVGEAFDITKRSQPPQPRGLNHLFNHGVTWALSEQKNITEAGHPLTNPQFSIVAPQLPDRYTSWVIEEHLNQINSALNFVVEGAPIVYIVGFSKGGTAAIRLGQRISSTRAILSIDASAMDEKPADVAAELSECKIPFWMIYTNYTRTEDLASRITDMHELVKADPHKISDIAQPTAPPVNSRCKTLVDLWAKENQFDRHTELCKIVTTSAVPFQWLLQH